MEEVLPLVTYILKSPLVAKCLDGLRRLKTKNGYYEVPFLEKRGRALMRDGERKG